ncbi:MAG: dihydrofolate reductase family protein [Solirubrobacterales bacterium]|nr:dihydrofolate reductase family protein [Solirubrobacterales bacterium]
MSKVVVSQFITLDGVVEDPGGAEKSPYGGWAFQFDRGPEGDTFKFDELMAAGALLLGRRTYEGFAEAWPSRDGEFADKFNSMPKYVISSTLENPAWNNTTVVGTEVAAAVERIKGEVDDDILVNGSVQLVHELINRGLVDELRLMVFPILTGGGVRLFPDGGGSRPLRLTEARQAAETLITIYEPVREKAQ